MRLGSPRGRICILIAAMWLTAGLCPCAQGAVALDTLGRYLTSHDYGGAQLVHPDNFFRVPFNIDEAAGDFTIDTGASITVVYRASLRKLHIKEIPTDIPVHGAFGAGRERFGHAVIKNISLGNCDILNLPVGVTSDYEGSGIFRRYGSTDGLFGLREMRKYAAVIDFGRRLLYLRPAGPAVEMGKEVRKILLSEGYTPVKLTFVRSHLRAPAVINGFPCSLIVDSGIFITSVDREIAIKAKIGGKRTDIVMRGVAKSGGEIQVATFPKMAIGRYEINDASVGVIALSPDVLGNGTHTPAAGFLGAEYLGRNSAVFDFNSRTLYLKAKPKIK